MIRWVLLLSSLFDSARPVAGACAEVDAYEAMTPVDALADVTQQLESAGGNAPGCAPVIRALERRICADTSDDLYSRAAGHASLRDVLLAQGQSRAAELHCCMELALRRDLAARAGSDVRHEVNAEYLRGLEEEKNCQRSPICPADVLAPGFSLGCDSVAALMEGPPPVVEGPRPPQPATSGPPSLPKVHVGMRRAGVASISLAGIAGAALLAGMGVGLAATQQIRQTEGDARMAWDRAGKASEVVMAVGGALALVGVALGVSLLRCGRTDRCGRARRSDSPAAFGLAPTGFAAAVRF
ncbi:hypothetical protein [Nannocystis sp. SCPEA4]|uniref:hypothetical protein n=1 Tax=Nannocystis sp. SCPEA4 TaxID=2996787 RepID=UPI0022717CA8|nr:hypothetical protein [Nannocystis sp. SCPEA4]MCY1060184.1 hypothetical protein [Nannocystis sp. SCPEA4]